MPSEVEQIRLRYDRRSDEAGALCPEMIHPYYYMRQQEKERAYLRLFKKFGLAPLHNKTLFEVGCGTGDNLIQFSRFGFRAENMAGNELLDARADESIRRLPSATQIYRGDASELDLNGRQYDIVLQSTVFSSILDDDFQKKLAHKMWSWVKPGGGILWYDFTYNNPRNPDVRGVPAKKVRTLFPEGAFEKWRISLAPPISRVVTKLHPKLYPLANAFPFLRTHVLCWIQKKP